MDQVLSSSVLAFRLLAKDFEILLEYVHPHEDNLRTYSHRIYELLLRASTEFEGLAKYGASKYELLEVGRNTNIKDLSVLNTALDTKDAEIGLIGWQPHMRFITPLEGGGDDPHRLEWYRSYNAVKHDRSNTFHQANLKCLVFALGGCFLLLTHLGGIKFDPTEHIHHDDGVEWIFPAWPFSVRRQGDPPLDAFV